MAKFPDINNLVPFPGDMTSQQTHESTLDSFFVYCPELGQKEGTEERKVLYYYPENIPLARKVRNIGLCEALVNFTRTFSPDKPCESVHTQKKRQIFFEPEPGIWMILTVTIPSTEMLHSSERLVEYHENFVQDTVLQAALKRAYEMFLLFNGTIRNIEASQKWDAVKKRLEIFFSRYWKAESIPRLDIFSVYLGVQFLPLDKSMYLKVHCFVNLVETTFRAIKRSMFLFGDQLVWSGLTQKDTKIFYHYIVRHTAKDMNATVMQSINVTSSVTSSVSAIAALPSGFIVGESGTDAGKKSTWVYIDIGGSLTACRLFIYAASGCLLCMFVQGDPPPSGDFTKRLEVYLGPRIIQLGTEIAQFGTKSRSLNNDAQYKMVYFNEMNLAVKSPMLNRRPPQVIISSDMMHLLTQINAEYDRVDEGETIIRTLSDYWVVARKNGHRRFFVIITQKSVNFAEVNEEVRKICQKEFSNIYFFD